MRRFTGIEDRGKPANLNITILHGGLTAPGTEGRWHRLTGVTAHESRESDL